MTLFGAAAPGSKGLCTFASSGLLSHGTVLMALYMIVQPYIPHKWHLLMKPVCMIRTTVHALSCAERLMT